MTGERDALFVGVDIGGTSVEAVVADRSNAILARGIHATDAADADGVLASATAIIRGVVGEATPNRHRIASIGVGVPGQVDIGAGVVRLALNLNIGVAGFPLGPAITGEFGAATFVENDVRAAAVGAYETLHEDTPGLHVLTYLGIGTGIAAGVVIDGRLHRGRDGMAGEIGHLVVAVDGPDCRCGLKGCLESVAAGPAIGRMWSRGDGKPAEDLFRAAAEGLVDAARVADLVTGHLAQAIYWLALGYGTDLVVLGGGVGSIEGLLAGIRLRLDRLGNVSELARRMVPPQRVVAMPAGFPTGAIGAAAVARHRFGSIG